MARVATGAMFEVVEGGVGDLLVVQGRTGMVARKRPTYRRPTSPGQAAQAARMERAGALWNAISDADALAWGRWAEGIVKVASVGGRRYSPTGYNAFMELTLRAIQASPLRVPPSRPPARGFLGDGAVVRVEAGSGESLPLGRGRGGVESVAEGGRTPTLPFHLRDDAKGEPHHARASSLSADPPRGEESPTIRFVASKANAEGCAVELLVQRLASARRKPGRQYKSMAFVRFEEGELGFDLPVAAGAYACAARTLDPITGQAMGMALLGVVTVG